MKKLSQITLLSLLFSLSFLGIPINSKAQIADVKAPAIDGQLAAISAQLNAITKAQWREKRLKIDQAIGISADSEHTFELYKQMYRNSSLLATLIEANNPSSPIFGSKSYNDIIIEKAKTNFVDALPDAENKSRFTNILSNLSKSPIITSILNSNPVTSLASSIIGAASQFFTATNTGQKVTAINASFKEERLKAFEDDIMPFVNYYNKLYIANQNFKKRLEELNKEKESLQALIPGSHKRLITALDLGLNQQSLQAQFFSKYPDANGTFETYNNYMEKPEIIKALKIVEEIGPYQKLLDSYKVNYEKAIAGLIDDSKLALQDGIEIAKSNKLPTGKLEQLMSSLDGKNETPAMQGVLNKYKRN